MNTLKDIKINGIKYYHADDLISLKLSQFKSCTNGRRLISNLNIDDNNYIFATNKSGKWIKTDGKSRKFDKVLIKVSWIKDNISDDDESDNDNNDDNNNNSDNEDNLENEIVMAPGIIKLTKNEKIRDDKKKIVDIEVRGTRDPRNCFFKASDVSKGFGMKKLRDSVTQKNRGYKLEIHYRYFNFKKTAGKGYCKKLYLTFTGMEKVINCSRSIHIQNAMIARKWLSQFSINMKCNDLVLDYSKSSISNIGYTYCITSDTIDADKIGYWKGMKKDLISRYKTYYGDTVKIFCVKTMYPELLEKKCHQHFKKYKLSHELYDKSKSEEYKLFLKENKMTPSEQDIYEDQQMTKTDVETLFTAHLGTQDQKNMLCSKLMGITTDIVKEVFNKTSSTLPTLYLFTIGKVKDLRVTLDIGEEYDDECIVAKGGETIDLTRRIDEHTESYGKMPGAKLLLKCYNYIDPQYTSKAETDLFQVLKKMNYIFKHPKYKEIIIYTKKESDLITKEFGKIARDYTGHIKEISDKLKCFENKHNIMKLEYEKEMVNREKEIANKEKEIIQLEKENSNLKYQNKILELKYKNKLLEKDKKIAKLEKNIKKNGSK
ncbi:hypothetical protein LBA_01140 [Megavirus lba]|uniref:Bro-N domain-containing protein n=1 Tax=Megavirus lba TaxID=1235314 RepID=L7Y7R4_9VIRU|nr:hypothetical protein LBA_01140 [Megavirus lba]